MRKTVATAAALAALAVPTTAAAAPRTPGCEALPQGYGLGQTYFDQGVERAQHDGLATKLATVNSKSAFPCAAVSLNEGIAFELGREGNGLSAALAFANLRRFPTVAAAYLAGTRSR